MKPIIKYAGGKTKLVPMIRRIYNRNKKQGGRWIEPFLGAGSVLLGIAPQKAIVGEADPNIVNLFDLIRDGYFQTREFIDLAFHEIEEHNKHKNEYYYALRERFNKKQNALDLLFLNICCTVCGIRYNSSGNFNAPYGGTAQDMRPSQIFLIQKRASMIKQYLDKNEIIIKCQDFRKTISEADENDFIYCDPPYIGLACGYFGRWNDQNETALKKNLIKSGATFLVSSWERSSNKINDKLKNWEEFNILKLNHKYYSSSVSSKEAKDAIEVMITNGSLENEMPLLAM